MRLKPGAYYDRLAILVGYSTIQFNERSGKLCALYFLKEAFIVSRTFELITGLEKPISYPESPAGSPQYQHTYAVAPNDTRHMEVIKPIPHFQDL